MRVTHHIVLLVVGLALTVIATPDSADAAMFDVSQGLTGEYRSGNQLNTGGMLNVHVFGFGANLEIGYQNSAPTAGTHIVRVLLAGELELNASLLHWHDFDYVRPVIGLGREWQFGQKKDSPLSLYTGVTLVLPLGRGRSSGVRRGPFLRVLYTRQYGGNSQLAAHGCRLVVGWQWFGR